MTSPLTPEAFDEVIVKPDARLLADRAVVADMKSLVHSYRALQLLYQVGLDLCTCPSLEELSNKITLSLIRLMPLERCFIATFDDSQTLQPLTQHHIDLSVPYEHWPISKSMIKRATTDGSSILSLDAQADADLNQFGSVTAHQIRSVMCVPIGQPPDCHGVIYVDNRAQSLAPSRPTIFDCSQR